MIKLYLCFSESDTDLCEQVKEAVSTTIQLESYTSVIVDDNAESLLKMLQQDMDGSMILVSSRTNWESRLLREIENARQNYVVDTQKLLFVLMFGSVSLPDYLLDLPQIILPDQASGSAINEKITKYLSQQNTSKPSGNYWLIKLNGNTWNIAGLKKGGIYDFSSHHHFNQAQGDYHYFEEIQKDDVVLAYVYNTLNAVVGLFKVSRSLYINRAKQEIIDLELTNIFDPVILKESLNALPFFNQLNVDVNEKLFPLDPEAAKRLLSTAISPGTVEAIQYQQFSITKFNSDVPSSLIKDELDFTPNIDALAGLIAYKDMQPPLSVGLFGFWESGKSFFMKNLESTIRSFTESGNTAFCTKVVHLTFNSWHYSDANLWASLITSVFDGLRIYKQNEPEQLEKLFSNLHSTRDLATANEAKWAEAKQQVDELRKKSVDLQSIIDEKVKTLSDITIKDVARAVFHDKTVKSQLDDIKKEFGKDGAQDIEKLDQQVQQFESTGGKLKEIFKEAYSLKNGKGLWAFFLAVSVIAIIYIITNLLPNLNVTEFAKAAVAGLTLFLSQLLVFIQPATKIIDKLSERLKTVRATIEELKQQEKEKYEAQQEHLKSEIDNAIKAQDIILEQEKTLKTKITDLETELRDIKSGKKIESFIEAKAADQRYAEGLGMISWIRKDLEQLNYLLKEQFEATIKETTEEPKLKIAFEVQRIILYIDDLDRCDAKTVVNVLEAIHLLLAFPLFVVVVGVDPRWMNNALNQRFEKLLDTAQTSGTEMAGITSKAYLEKIFQIPFLLKPANATQTGKLIAAQFSENELFEDKITPPDLVGKSSADSALDNDLTTSKKTDESGSSQTNRPPAGTFPSLVNIERQSALLRIGTDEIKVMRTIGPLIGLLPRTIKRYVNIYRIIRSHSRLTLGSRPKLEYYVAVMLLLGASTGFETSFPDFINLVRQADEKESFLQFLKSKPVQLMAESKIAWLISEIGANNELSLAGGLPLKCFQQNIDMVRLFSFDITMD